MKGPDPQPGRSNYLDFEVEIGLGRGRDYPVTVLDSPAGEAEATMHFPYDDLALDLRLGKLQIALLRSGGKHRRAPTEEEQAVQDLGRSLFDALFCGRVRSCYEVSLREAAQQEMGLRLKLRIRPPELCALPWEFLYDPDQAEYVCLSRQTPIVRYLESPRLIRPLTVSPPLRILGMVASPENLPVLDIEREKQRVERATETLRDRGLLELEWLPGQTWRDLQEAMWGGPWHVFHFIGHGGFDVQADEGFIALADRAGRMSRLSATRLGRLLADHAHLRLVLLNACEGARGSGRDVYSSTASILVHRGIPAVVAMQYEITDRAAIEFARAFYRALAYGLAVDEAVVAARKAIDLAVPNSVEWGMPVLYMRTPDGVLFEITETERVERAIPKASKPTPEAEKELQEIYVTGLGAFWNEEWDEAIRCFQVVLDAIPDYRNAAPMLGEAKQRQTLDGLYEQSQAAREAGDWATAVSALGRLVAEAPEYKDAAIQLETAKKKKRLADLYAQAQELHGVGQWQAVVNVFAQIDTLDPDYADPEGLQAAAKQEMAKQEHQAELDDLYSRAILEMEAGRWSQAYQPLARLQEMEPGFRASDRLLVQVEAEIKKQEVEAQSRQAELDDLYSRAIGEMETGHWEEAVGLFVEIQEREPGFCETEELLAQAVSKLKTTVGEWIAPASGEVRLFGGVEMVYVPAGPFLMGSEDYADQKPRHEVDVSGFWIDRTPVTNEEYRRFVEATGHTKPTHWVSSRIPEGKESHPVTHVSWQDAQAYCRWRSGRAGVEIRLPSEAEWEKAARGIGGRRYPWGNKLFGRKPSPRVSDLGGTRPVGHGSPAGDSPYGVADMAGNVWEWTGSLYKPYPYDQADGREELESGGRRVLRGGSWRYDERYVRAANRFNYDPSYSDDYIGFRCACSDSER